jgi:hypothetical protein
MLIGYPRTSMIEHEAGLLARRRDVSARGCGEIQRQGCKRQSKGPRGVEPPQGWQRDIRDR